MPRVLVVYYSSTGNTRQMAEEVVKGVKKEGVKVELKEVAKTNPEDLLEVDGIIMGSPTYYGTMAAPLKELLDKSVKYHGRLEGKVGGAFSSAGGLGGGNETTVLSILQALLVHGMIIPGTSDGCHYGPVSVEAPDQKAALYCQELGSRVAKLVKRLAT